MKRRVTTGPTTTTSRVLSALVVLLSLALHGQAAETPPEMVRIEGGVYVPLFKNEAKVTLAPFLLDRHPVTNREFFDFVQAHPSWRKSSVRRIFADASYLRSWPQDLDYGGTNNDRRPVTGVSWFAARAYAEWVGKRLPTLAEWEFVAAASESLTDARSDTNFVRRILEGYARPVPAEFPEVGHAFTNLYGISDLHGLVWEWVDDFNASLVTGESREDTGLNRGLFCGAGSVAFSDFRDYAAFMRFAFRGSLRGNYCVKNLGFRCARTLENPP